MRMWYRGERFCYTIAGWMWHEMLVRPELYLPGELEISEES